jgi:glycosyltransferase involved in cell wall biosynthesis
VERNKTTFHQNRLVTFRQVELLMNSHTQSDRKPSVCFVALDNFAALTDDPKYGHIGGAELQQAIIGRELAKRGYRVSFITLDHGQDDEMELDGMRIIKAYKPNAGIRILRFLHPRLTSLWHAMKKADADIYYQRTRDSVTGIVAAFCRTHRRKFVFAVASDYHCMTEPPYHLPKHTRILYRYGLRRASLVITQTQTQKKLLRENFGIEGTVIPNCAPDYGRYLDSDTMTSTRGRRLVWIGSFSPVKRLELLLDIAEQLPNLQFDVVGDGDDKSQYVQNLRSRAKTMPNVRLHGRIPHVDVHQFYQQASVLICTSQTEGFPNIFLEAWSHGVPVVSTVDPDSLIIDKKLGVVAQDISGLAGGIRSLYESPDQSRKMSRNARRYYLENYTVNAAMAKFEKAFTDINRESDRYCCFGSSGLW